MNRDDVQHMVGRAQDNIMEPKRYRRCILTFLDGQVQAHSNCTVFYGQSAVEVQVGERTIVYPMAALRSYEVQ